MSSLRCGIRCACGQPRVDKADEQVASFEAGVTQDYRIYWNLRNRQASPASYDADYRFELSGDERQQFVKLGWSTAQIDDYSDTRTDEYHRLHTRLYGDTPDSVQGFVPDVEVATFAYQADGAEETEPAAARNGPNRNCNWPSHRACSRRSPTP